MYLNRKIVSSSPILKLSERATCSSLLLQVIFKGLGGAQLASINGSSISLKITAQKYNLLYGLFQQILTDFRVYVCRCSLACSAGFIMKTWPVLVTDYSDWRLKWAKSHSGVLFILIQKTADKIIDYFMLKGTSGGQHAPQLSSQKGTVRLGC